VSGTKKAEFTLASELGSAGITITRADVKIGKPIRGGRVHVPKRWPTGMITGYHAIEHIAPRSGASIPKRLIPAMKALFPTGWPYVYQGDNY